MESQSEYHKKKAISAKKSYYKNFEKNRIKKNIASTKWHENNYEKYMEQKKQYYHNNLEKIKSSQRKYQIESTYNIEIEEYHRMIKSQDNKCMICGKMFDVTNKPNIDHDHKTKEVRDILCRKCNQGLGFFNDDADTMQKATNYIIKWHKIIYEH